MADSERGAEFPPYVLSTPSGDPIPLICDSPHSGTRYPADFGSRLPRMRLRMAEDTDVDRLWSALPALGATLLAAQFPRSYIDPNRDPADLDPAMLAGPWEAPLAPSEKTRLGIGLIWARVGRGPQDAIYDRRLDPREVRRRIACYHQPYHREMQRQIEAAHARFGTMWHLNLHSMPSDAYQGLQLGTDRELADFVLGDRDGTSCEPEFTDMVAQALRRHGYRVALNDPYKGVALIAAIGRPAQARHSLQIEVHRGLYMDERTRARGPGFESLRRSISAVATEIASYVRQRIG